VSRGKQTATVPNVVGKSQSAAESELKAAGFKVKVTSDYSETVDKGKVISQSPSAGFEGVEGSTVSIVVSKGSEMVTVPDTIGSSQTEAEQTLQSKGLKVTVEYEPHAENGLVIDQDPVGGSTVKLGTTIKIIVDAVQP
jgi:serine/threonine-protein kinase